MQFPEPLQHATLLTRYKRFMADVRCDNGEQITLHCPNTGSMKNCQTPGSSVWFTDSGNPKRKYPCTWQIVENTDGQLVGVNTGLANKLVADAIAENLIAELAGFESLQTEVKYGNQNSRIDILLGNTAAEESCFVEVKNVSLAVGNRHAIFPDAVTTRGHKHLQELMLMRSEGHRAVLFFCVQISAVDSVSPADTIDPEYGRLLRQAVASGVEVLAYGAEFDLAKSRINLSRKLAVRLEQTAS